MKAAIVLACFLCGCVRTNHIDLEYLGTPLGPLGFTCTDGTSPLADRIAAAHAGCLVVDFLRTPGASTEPCGAFNVEDPSGMRIERHEEALVPDDLAACASFQAGHYAECLIERLDTRAAAANAPDGVVLVRATLLAGACPGDADLATLGDRLVGCAHSCPVVLDEISGNLSLYLAVDADRCDASMVSDCARD